jgi:hypothetical protein
VSRPAQPHPYPPPGPALEKAVRAAFEWLGTEGQVKLTQFYRTMPKHFDGERSKWFRAEKRFDHQITFTERIVRVLSGTETADAFHSLGGFKAYRVMYVRAIANPDFKRKVDVAVSLLNGYLSQVLRPLEEAEDKTRRVAPKRARDGNKVLGPFPFHIRPIVARVYQSTHSVIAHLDAVDFGSSRAFDLHRELVEALIDRARKGVSVHVLISTDGRAFSIANKFKDDNARKSADFVVCLDDFLTALSKTALGKTDEYLNVRQALNTGADFVNPKGSALQTLKLLMMRLHDRELQELQSAGVVVRGPNRVVDLTQESVPAFYWIFDGREGIHLVPTLGTDAIAFPIEPPGLIASYRMAFYKLFNENPVMTESASIPVGTSAPG